MALSDAVLHLRRIDDIQYFSGNCRRRRITAVGGAMRARRVITLAHSVLRGQHRAVGKPPQRFSGRQDIRA